MIVVPYVQRDYDEMCLNPAPGWSLLLCCRPQGHTGRHYDGYFDEDAGVLEIKKVWA